MAQECTQRYGLDYEETFCPVIRFESEVVALGAQHQFHLHQMDVSTAFFHEDLTGEVYVRQPEGYVEPGKKHQVCQLKAKYLLPQTVAILLESCLR